MVGVEQSLPVNENSTTGLNSIGPSVTKSQNDPEHRTLTTTLPEPNLKRARFGSDLPTTGPVNGLAVNNPDRLTNGGWPFRPDLMQLFRSTFDNRFKECLQHHLSSYVTRLNKTEINMNAMKEEFKEITERMDCIEKASKDLKKVIRERAALPTPTAGVGHQRTVSSQAPRLPPTTATTNTAVPVSSSPAVATSNFINAPIPVPITFPFVTPIPQPPLATVPIRTPLISSNKPLGSLVSTRPSAPAQCSLAKTALNVRPLDTIDLTSDSSPTVDEFVPPPKKVTESPAVPNRVVEPVSVSTPNMLSAVRPFTNHNPIATVPMVPNNPRPAYPGAITISPPMGKNPNIVFDPRQMSFIELQRLPVAPLPPVPLQTPLPTPVQPMPQLTIAEAAEGVCLQWNLLRQSIFFEQATSYEIYSYASSEVTLATIGTCQPWKKVGDVAALPLPMACTLTHVQPNNLYYFIVRSVDRFHRYSQWSNVVNAYVG